MHTSKPATWLSTEKSIHRLPKHVKRRLEQCWLSHVRRLGQWLQRVPVNEDPADGGRKQVLVAQMRVETAYRILVFGAYQHLEFVVVVEQTVNVIGDSLGTHDEVEGLRIPPFHVPEWMSN
jgi:hypothetical protein